MSTMGGKNDLPDFSNVRPLARPEDLAGLNQAIAQFDLQRAAFAAAAEDAEKTVNLTLAWIGVGEKLLGLASAILQQQKTAKASDPSQTREQPGSSGLANKLGVLSSLCESLAKVLPAPSGR